MNRLFIFVTLVALFNSCSNDATTTSDTTVTTEARPEQAATPNTAAPITKDLIYPINQQLITWVDNLNLRKEPDTKAEVITTLSEGSLVTFAGDQSDETLGLTLRGIVFREPWIKVAMPNGTNGWIFAGAVRTLGEDKGTAVITEHRIDIPNFGHFDLLRWKSEGTKREEAGDATIETSTYSKDGMIFEIENSDVGEYGYTRTHTLKDAGGNVLRQHQFNITPAVSGNNFTLFEVVGNYETGKKYIREETRGKQPRPKAFVVQGSATEHAL